MIDSEEILLRVEQKDINFINQIMEGYEYLGVVTTLKKGSGLLRIRTTKDTKKDVLEILSNLPRNVEIIKS